MDEIFMTPEVCMQFLVWSYYYHDIIPQRDTSYSKYGKFSPADAERLDSLKDILFKCYEQDSVLSACRQFQLARQRNEPCPFAQSALDGIFAEEKPSN